jgi:hypothetical protein
MFKSKEEKMKKRAEKELAKQKAALEKLGLNLAAYDIDMIKKLNANSAREISSSLAGSKLYSFGSLLSGNSNETFALEMARAQVEENLILIRQNEIIIRLLSKLVDTK